MANDPASCCPLLAHVDLSFCQLITDSSLQKLAFCRSLVALDLQGCILVSDAGVKALLDGKAAEGLESLVMDGCDVGDLSLEALVRANASRPIEREIKFSLSDDYDCMW